MSERTPEEERIRGYLIAQAAKLSLPDLIEKVRTDALQVWDAAAAVPAGRFSDRPADGEWSAAEVLKHVLTMTENSSSSITGILRDGALPPRILDTMEAGGRPGFLSAEDYRRAFDETRVPLYEAVAKAEGDERLDVKIEHPNFGGFSWREWFLFMRVHDLDHMRQLQAIASAFGPS
jgi:hypothetical protein